MMNAFDWAAEMYQAAESDQASHRVRTHTIRFLLPVTKRKMDRGVCAFEAVEKNSPYHSSEQAMARDQEDAQNLPRKICQIFRQRRQGPLY